MESQYLAQGPCSWSNLKNFDPLIVLSWLSHLGPWLLHLQAAQGALCPSALFPTISLPRRQNTLCWTQTHTLTRGVQVGLDRVLSQVAGRLD